MRVLVAVVTPQAQEVVPVELACDATLGEAVARSGLLARYGLDLTRLQVAVFGERRRIDALVADGDRIELLRPLMADPKAARRARAQRRRRS